MREWSVTVRFVWLLGALQAMVPGVHAATLRHVENGETVFEADIPEGWELRPGGSGDEGYVIDSAAGTMLQLTLNDGTAEAREAAVASTRDFVAENYQDVEWFAPAPLNIHAEPGETLAGKAFDSEGNEVGLLHSFLTLGNDVHLEVWIVALPTDEDSKRLADITRSLRLPGQAAVTAAAPSSAARAQVQECLSSAGASKTAISEYYAALGQFPPADQFGDPEGSRYCGPLAHDDAGLITVTMRSDAPVHAEVRGVELQLQASVTDGVVADWRCSTGAAHTAYLPNACR